jgi:hypothetical protein
MKKYIALAVVFAVALAIACSGGGYSAPSGSIMQDTSLALRNDTFAPGTPVGAKSGEACAVGYLGIVSSGDASLKAAAAKGGITKIYYTDFRNDNLLGSVISKTCTIARGD